jgi:hypothetical protein
LLKLPDAKSDALRRDSVKAVNELFVKVTNAAAPKARIEQLDAKASSGEQFVEVYAGPG